MIIDSLWNFFMVCFYMIIFGCFCFLEPLGKERFSAKKFAAISSILIIMAAFFYRKIQMGDWYWFFRPLMLAAVIMILVKTTTNLNLNEMIYYSIWIYLVREFGFDFTQVIENYIGRSESDYFRGIWMSVWFVLIFLVIYFTVARNLPENGEVHVSRDQLSVAALLTVFLTVLKPFAIIAVMDDKIYSVFIIVQIVLNFFTMMALYQMHQEKRKVSVEQELLMQKRLWTEHEKQMERARHDAELISMKYHDLKYFMDIIREEKNVGKRELVFRDMEKTLNGFVSQIHTDNEILDTVLTEKAILCEKNNIKISCVADGKLLDKINAVDLYVLFGNAIDNAIEAVINFENEEKKIITIAVFKVHSMVKIQIENYYESRLIFEDNLPVTIKKDKENHGFGLKSIQSIAEKYDGYVTTEQEDNIFTLHILLPLEASYEEKATR